MANRQTDTASFAVDADDLYFDFFANFQHFVGVDHTVPGNLGHVDQAIGSADIDESAKICQAGDTTLAYFAFSQVFQDLVADLVARFGAGSTLAEDQAVTLSIDFDDTNSNGITDEALVLGFGGLTGHA